ncbi:hypothetical protein AGMMS4957_09940 [Bacteroidia bacterium]|nr:hypothetical protein AGMMS4957_09940 [Bacteroidia bacterium]
MENNDIEGFVKYPLFHKEQKKSFKTNAFLAQNLYIMQQKTTLSVRYGSR